MSAEPTSGQIEERDRRIAALEQKVATLETKVPDSHLFDGNFLKRAFTIWGHYFVANFIIGMGVVAIMAFFAIIMLFSGAAFFNW